MRENYGSLVDGGHRSLCFYDMGQEQFLDALHLLATYKPSADKDYDRKRLGPPLASLCVMIAEAARFKPILWMMSLKWLDSGRLTEAQTKLVVRWSRMSYALLHWDQTQEWEDDDDDLLEIGMQGPNDAIAAINILIWPRYFDFQD
ncbi:hypothetical protein ACP70R_032206 [Stipagrostis hirtigluma subsp. patula]